MIKSAATEQFKAILAAYQKVLPLNTFPWVPLAIAAIFQVLAWFGGRFLGGFTLFPRILLL